MRSVRHDGAMTEGPAGRLRRLAVAVAELLEPEENPAGAIYGAIACGALLAAEATRRETLEEAAGAVALTVGLFWLAHAYAHSLGHRLESGEHWSLHRLTAALRHESAILRGALAPMAVLLLTRAAGAGTSTAVGAALISAAVLVFLLELLAGARSGQPRARMAAHIAIGALLGLGVLALKVVLH